MKVRRGIGEIMGSLMILLIVAVAGAVLLNLSVTTSYANQNSLLTETKTQEDIAQERVVIISVVNAGSDLKIVFMNYGKIDVKITDIYVDNIRYDHNKFNYYRKWVSGSWVVPYPEGVSQVSDLNIIDLTLVNPLLSHSFITVVSERGGSTVLNWTKE